MNLKHAVAFAAFSLVSASAMSATYAIGTLPTAPASYTNLATVAVGAFTDTFTFTAPAATSTTFASASSVDLMPFFNVGNLTLSLFTSANVLIASGVTGPVAGDDSTISAAPLASGASYYYRVTGTATGASGGFYALVASATPVPEPETYALMLAGVAAVGFVVMRRRG